MMYALLMGMCLSPVGWADMNQRIWLGEDAGVNLPGVREFHADKRPGMVLNPAPSQENVLDGWHFPKPKTLIFGTCQLGSIPL